jgi:hypothetical protein
VPEKSDPLTVVPTGARVRELFSGFGHRQVEGCAEEVALSSDLPDSELIAGSRTEPATGAVLGVAFSARCPGPGDWEYGVLASGYVNSTKQLPPGAPRQVEPVAECTASE